MILKSMLILCIGLAAFAQTPVFLPGAYVNAGGSPIDVGYYGSPFVYDWNGDGIKDLIVGQFTSGNIRFYPNSGSNANPIFNSFSYLQADGVNISVYAS